MTNSHKPTQYQKGWTEFFKLKFKVTPDVLIPRPETELLIEQTINFLRQLPEKLIQHNPEKPWAEKARRQRIIEVGTGSGCIAIALAKNLPPDSYHIIATDISAKALKVAQLNLKFHQIRDVFLVESDLLGVFSPLTESRANKPDVIVANLPYIPTQRIPYLDPSVKDFEPIIALDGGEDGFLLYTKLFQQMSKKNLTPAVFLGEIDYTHGEIAQQVASKYFPDAQVEIKLDLAHKQRILQIIF